MQDTVQQLVDQVKTAAKQKTKLIIRGGGTRQFYGNSINFDYDYLDTAAYSGVISYEPSELVLTARAGTPLTEIEQLLAENQQMLAFESPRFGAGTFGGCIASGMSGPRRMAVGPLSDFVLGTRFLNSDGQILRFGGEVMKNVAGYDLSRLLAGSLGTLGVILEASIKVLPKPYAEKTCVLQVDEATALEHTLAWHSQPLPISATAWCCTDAVGQLWVRVSGNESAVNQALNTIGGEVIADDVADSFWLDLRDQKHDFFQDHTLWRVSLPMGVETLGLGPTLHEWGGALRWLSGDYDPSVLRAQIQALGGSVCLYKSTEQNSDIPAFDTLSPVLVQIQQRLKQQLDPADVFSLDRLLVQN